eukprot:gene18074-biopygen8378
MRSGSSLAFQRMSRDTSVSGQCTWTRTHTPPAGYMQFLAWVAWAWCGHGAGVARARPVTPRDASETPSEFAGNCPGAPRNFPGNSDRSPEKFPGRRCLPRATSQPATRRGRRRSRRASPTSTSGARQGWNSDRLIASTVRQGGTFREATCSQQSASRGA